MHIIHDGKVESYAYGYKLVWANSIRKNTKRVCIRNDLSLKLFDVKNDPGERKDLSLLNTEKVKELEAAYNEWCTANIGKY